MGGHRFRFDERHKLDAPERSRSQPPAPLVDLVAGSPPGPVLDLGAGTGYLALPLARRFPDRPVIALDAVPAMSALLAARAAEAGADAVACAVAEAGGDGALPLADGTLAAVVAVSLAHELEDLAGTLADIGRVLKHDGLLLLCDWSPEGSPDVGPPLGHRLPGASVEAELIAAGWRQIGRPALYADHWVITATCPKRRGSGTVAPAG